MELTRLEQLIVKHFKATVKTVSYWWPRYNWFTGEAYRTRIVTPEGAFVNLQDLRFNLTRTTRDADTGEQVLVNPENLWFTVIGGMFQTSWAEQNPGENDPVVYARYTEQGKRVMEEYRR